MDNSIIYLLNLMKNPENRVLVILDISASINSENIENALFDIALAHNKFDPQGQRLIAITDDFARVRSKEGAIAIPVGIRNVKDVPGNFFGGGGDDIFEKVGKEAIYQELQPTHLMFYSDMVMPLISKEEVSTRVRDNLVLCIYDQGPGDRTPWIQENFGSIGTIIQASTKEKRDAILAAIDAEKLSQETQPARASHNRVRI